jgi:hypothetical protein
MPAASRRKRRVRLSGSVVRCGRDGFEAPAATIGGVARTRCDGCRCSRGARCRVRRLGRHPPRERLGTRPPDLRGIRLDHPRRANAVSGLLHRVSAGSPADVRAPRGRVWRRAGCALVATERRRPPLPPGVRFACGPAHGRDGDSHRAVARRSTAPGARPGDLARRCGVVAAADRPRVRREIRRVTGRTDRGGSGSRRPRTLWPGRGSARARRGGEGLPGAPLAGARDRGSSASRHPRVDHVRSIRGRRSGTRLSALCDCVMARDVGDAPQPARGVVSRSRRSRALCS